MRFERGLCLGIQNADRDDAAGIGLGPVESFDAAADARLAADIELLGFSIRPFFSSLL